MKRYCEYVWLSRNDRDGVGYDILEQMHFLFHLLLVDFSHLQPPNLKRRQYFFHLMIEQ